jgi:hypothetical protein
MDNLFANYRQVQAIADKPHDMQVDTTVYESILASPVIQTETLVSSGAVELGNPLASRTRMVVRNLDPIRTARIGGAGITEKTGIMLEPLAELAFAFDSGTAVSLYGRAVYGEVKVEVIES